MKVLDLFSGFEGWSKPFRDRGHQVLTLDNDPVYGADIVRDILDIKAKNLGYFDIVLASPPCTQMTVMQIGRHWNKDHTPKTTEAVHALKLVQHTVNLIAGIGPQYWIMENPRAKLRKLYPMTCFERHTVTYCQYGEQRMKPTDLWGKFPPSLALHKPCNNGGPCHVATPRGSTFSQGKNAFLAAEIPYQLALDVCLAAEKDVV